MQHCLSVLAAANMAAVLCPPQGEQPKQAWEPALVPLWEECQQAAAQGEPFPPAARVQLAEVAPPMRDGPSPLVVVTWVEEAPEGLDPPPSRQEVVDQAAVERASSQAQCTAVLPGSQ